MMHRHDLEDHIYLITNMATVARQLSLALPGYGKDRSSDDDERMQAFVCVEMTEKLAKETRSCLLQG